MIKKVVILLVLFGFRALYVGGNLNNGSHAGLLCSNSNNSAGNSNANISAQLSLKYLTDITTSALAEKNKFNSAVSIHKKKNPHYAKANMKRKGNLYDLLASRENIYSAYNNAKKGKLHYTQVRQIEKNPDDWIDQLEFLLKTETYKPSDYTIFKKYTGGKLREIYKLPFFPDRIIHHCIVQILQPIWMNLLIRDTFSTIPGKGIHDGVKRIKRALKDPANTHYCLKFDIRKFYPSINHGILKKILQRKIKDAKVNNLNALIIDSAPGIPIGNYISQWFGNIYLAYFDHYVKENLKAKYYYRYCDDMVVLSPDKEYLHFIFGSISEYLNNNLLLTIKNNYQIFPVKSRGIDFLGYKFFHTHTLVRKSIVKNFKSKIKHTQATKANQSAYWGWFKHANTYNLINKYFKNEGKQA